MDHCFAWFCERMLPRRAGAFLLALIMIFTTVSGMTVPVSSVGTDETETVAESAQKQTDRTGLSDSARSVPSSLNLKEDGSSEPQTVSGVLSDDGKTLSFEGFAAETVNDTVQNLRIRVEAEPGIFPEGTEMTVQPVKVDAYTEAVEKAVQGEVASVHAVDITFRDRTGEEVRPQAPVKVTIQSPLMEKEEAVPDVVHMDDKGLCTLVEETASEEDAVTLETDSFSVYALVFVDSYYRDCRGETWHVTVSFDKEAGIPADAVLSVSEIRKGSEGYDGYVERAAQALGTKPAFARAFDIALKNPRTGEEYQPDGTVSVRIELLKDTLGRYESVDVVHVPDNRFKGADVMHSTVNGRTVSFHSDGFSVYVLAGSGGETAAPQYTYTFFVPNEDSSGYKEYAFTDDRGNAVYHQTIKDGRELIVPQLPSTETEVFAGWYRGDLIEGTLTLDDQPYDFENITITENNAFDLYAVYKTYATAVFHDQYNSSSKTFPVACTRRAELVTPEGEEAAASIKVSDVTATYSSSGGASMAFLGWSETPITVPGAAEDDNGNAVAVISADENGCISVTGEKHLYPVFREIHWLTYYSAQSGLSAAYVPPARVISGDSAGTSLPVTSRDGYTFLGWWTGSLSSGDGVETVNYGAQISGPDGSLVSSADDGGVYINGGNLYLRSDVTLYARWEATYSIVYWKQLTTETPETTEKHYEYVEAVSRPAEIGSTVTVPEVDKADDRYAGYHFGHCDSSAAIENTKELTVLNVYYDLSETYASSGLPHTLTFADSVTGAGAAVMPDAVDALDYGTALKGFVPADPVSGRLSHTGKAIYAFSRWYMDQACTVPVDWDTMGMPDHDLTVYAGWESIRFRVEIDPNYGALYDLEGANGTGATYFNNSYDAEPIGEYTHVIRDYVESSSGTYYYVNHDLAYGGADRKTYYTVNPGLATEDTTFEYAPGTYTYIGWYEVYLDENGNETGEASEPYDFTQHTDHNTKLRLHWKKAGVYYLAYAAGDGTLEDGTKETILPDACADYANVTLARAASAPGGYTFVGWKIRGSDSSTIYRPGQTFTLHADDAVRVSGKEVIYLDAVYVRVNTASVVYDANGGVIAGSGVDFGYTYDSLGSEVAASGMIDLEAGNATVAGLVNNARFKLSDGTGFTREGAVFLGWSDKPVCDASATFYPKDSTDTYAVDSAEPVTLYAVWGVPVNYHLNRADADWGGEWDSSVYTLDSGTGTYSRTARIGTAVSEPVNVPEASDGALFLSWATRTGEDPYVYTEYDFTQPVAGALDLYAHWGEENTIKVHAVDASGENLEDQTDNSGWTVNDVTVTTEETELNGTSHVTETPENYEFAFAAVSDSLDSVSESNAVTAIRYEGRKVKVKYKGETAYRVLGSGSELYFVYYQKKALPIGCMSMDAGGALAAVPASGAPETTGEALLGTYNMTEEITQPLTWADNDSFTQYAFAIGTVGSASVNDLHLLTSAASSEDDGQRPQLQIRNTWRGFEYSTDGSIWVNCGYAPQLYVIYFTQQPTVIMLHEKTAGTSAVMDTAFTYELLVTQTTTTTTSVQGMKKNEAGEWINDGEPEVTEETGAAEIVFDTTASGNEPIILRNGEEDSAILFRSSSAEISEEEEEGGEAMTVTTITTVTAQTITITQAENALFMTTVEGDGLEKSETFSCTCTADGTGSTKNVIFTNTLKSLPVEVHVAVADNDGILQLDNRYRSTEEANYAFDLGFGESAAFLEKLSPADVFADETDTYAFGTVLYGTGSEGSAVSVESMDVASISFEQTGDGAYGLVLKDAGGAVIGELGDHQLYYLYYPIPRIRYVKEAGDGTLVPITGCLTDTETGSIVPSDSVTYSHSTLFMNGKTVAQDQGLEIPLSGLVISQSGNNFRMPPILDDGLLERYLSYGKLGVGSGDAAGISDLVVSDDMTMQLKVQDNALRYSFDGGTWMSFPSSGTPTVYAIYSERGYDLQISKAVDTSSSGENAIFTDSSFVVTVSSMAITKTSYAAEGADGPTVSAVPTDGENPGTITLTVTDGTKIRIKGLGQGDYTLTESGNENYTLTARTGSIVGTTTSAMEVSDNTTVFFPLHSEAKVDLTNSPKAICRIGDRYFYTLRSMVDYVEENIAAKTATAEMLTDYLMPAADAVEIPGGFDLTLTTAESVGHVAVITRTDALADKPLVTNNGTLTLTNLTLEGSGIEASAPVIRTAGDVTVGAGASIRNGSNSGNGGAIGATAGNITVSGEITGCSAAAGGAIYHAGHGTITLNGMGSVQNNTAAEGHGGAINLASGTISVSWKAALSGNKAADGRGGAIYAGNAVIEIGQNARVTGNTAKAGGAVFAETGTITISESVGVTPPAITGNTATEGAGGAIYVGAGSVTVSGGSLSNNTAKAGQGGGIYSDSASVSVSDSARIESNTATEGGAVYANSGGITVSGGTVESNRAVTGHGGAICAGSGNVTVSGGSVSKNTAEAGSGGAIYAVRGNVDVSGASLNENTARIDGGAVCAASGGVTVSGGAVERNRADTGHGGAICAAVGAVSISNASLTENTACTDGGAVYAGSGAVTLANADLGQAGKGNTAGQNGGAVYAGSGNVTVSGGSMTENTASGGNGGAVYVDSGSITLTNVTAAGNSAVNGAAVFTNTGRARFDDGSYTGNIASAGGAVGVGSVHVSLYFTGNVQIKDNTLGSGSGAPKSNVYLDQDNDAVINIDTLGGSAAIGIHVPDPVVPARSVPGARFAVYTSNSNVSKITNDRFPSLTVQSDTAAKKLYWGNSIKVSVHTLDSYGSSFTQPANSGAGTQLGKYDTYCPEFSNAAISELASELVVKNKLSIGTKVYAGAYLDGVRSFGDYITRLTWDEDTSEWYVTTRSGDTVYLKKTDNTGYYRIYIYYAEPSYLSIENNTDMALTISDMKVDETSVINTNMAAGYGMVFAKNGAIRTALLPITAEDLALAPGQSINLLIPGGRDKDYTLDGSFAASGGGSVRLRRTGVTEASLPYQGDGTFDQITGRTLNTSGTYQIIFGDDKYICKVVDAEGTEHPYSKISDAIAAIVSTTGANPPYTLETPKTAVIEMLTDYLLPASDKVKIPRGYDITITTAAKDGVEYPYTGDGDRATISRDSENTDSMIDAWEDSVTTPDGTKLRISELIFDGKSVKGSSDGGGVKSKLVDVYVDHVDFKNVYASNGGAMLIMFSAKDKNNKQTVKNTILEVKNSSFVGCTSTTTETSNRLGGGAIVTNAETMILENCGFDTCTAVDQAGAVFHRVDGNYNSWTIITGCTFTNCQANAAGGLELDSKNISVTGCIFEHCVATQRNGGGFNVYALNAATPTADCWVTVSGCTFNDCQLTTTNTSNGNGGGFRCNAVYTKVENSTFTNNQALYGGGFCISNGNAKLGEVYGCTFERNTANQGGGIYGKPLKLIIGDYTYTDEDGTEQIRHTEVRDCTSNNEGGGVYQNRNADGSSLTITNASITGNQTKNGSKNGGGVYTNVRTVEISDSAISDNTATGNGGGVWFDADNDTNRAKQVLTVKGSTIDGNISGGNGGGIYTQAKTVTIGASDTRTDEGGSAVSSSVSNNTAKTNGGGLYQSRNAAGSKLTVSDTAINGNTANNTNTGADQGGGGIYAGVRTLEITNSSVSNNTAKSHGGGILFEINNDDARNVMALTVTGCTLDRNTSGGNGGGIYTRAKTVSVTAYTDGEGPAAGTVQSSITNCTAAYSGGGIYHNRESEGSALTVTDTVISGCVSNDTSTNNNPPRGGGGIFVQAQTVTVKDSEISGNRAVRNGGGINAPWSGTGYALILDGSKVDGNTASAQGGGVFTRSQLTLRNGTEITGNRLTTNNAADCAGVYLLNNRTLFVGPEGAPEGFTDTVYVRDNTTASGTASNLRLWEGNGENNQESVYVYCSLEGEIRVVNANKVGTWFGSSLFSNPDGFSDDAPVFRADASTLKGIIDRTDPDGKKIIWAGPPIAKITDGEGNLLYLKSNGTSPAIFDRLYEGTVSTAYNSMGAFNMLNSEAPGLYTADGVPYTGTAFCVKMLVESYTTERAIHTNHYPDRKITFTTAGRSDTDGYPYEGSAARATVLRGSGVGNNSLFSANTQVLLTSIILDGNAEGTTTGGNTRLLYVNCGDLTVTLGTDALLQNAKMTGNGAGVCVNGGSFSVEGGTIRNCEARYGGGVYKAGGQSFTLVAGSIYQCAATADGGGVYLNGGTFTMSGGTISGCSAAKGGGVLVPDNTGSPFVMTGGSVINNSAAAAGGGIAVNGRNARIRFSGKVNVSGNTCDASLAANRICNVELNQDSNGVINTNNGGLYPGSYIGVYVPDGVDYYEKHGVEKKPFGTFATGDNTNNLYCFVNDRNGLKGGIIEDPDPNTIYWIQIFSLTVSKEVVTGSGVSADPEEEFGFTVHIRGNAISAGQKNAKDINTTVEGEYGEMWFTSNGMDTTTATFTLKAGESITGTNLSNGLTYEVIENLTPTQQKKYAILPTDVINGSIGENSGKTNVDPYVSSVEITNMLPVCKITDNSGNLLYRRYTVGTGEYAKDYNVPAVYTELTGENGAFKALEGNLYTGTNINSSGYSVSNGVQIQMLIANYTLSEAIALPASVNGSVTLTTASRDDEQFPKQDEGTTSTITRAFEEYSMITVGGDLTLYNVILDGAKSSFTARADGGIVHVENNGRLTIRNGATLQGSKTTAKGGAVYADRGSTVTMTGGTVSLNESAEEGGAVYVADGGVVTMTGGTVNRNESAGDGAGIYLAEGSKLNLSGNPGFGGNGLNVSGNIDTTKGNLKQGTLVAQTNGGKNYEKARQDIFIAGYEGDDGATNAASLVVTGNLSSGNGTIWVWAAEVPHYQMLQQFAVIAEGAAVTADAVHAFRNARDDTAAKNDTGEYLYGTLEGEKAGFVYWSGISGSRKVILRKVDSAHTSLKDREFSIYKGTSTTPYKPKDETVPLSGLTSGPSGCFWIGTLPYGWYILEETSPHRYFYLIVEASGVYGTLDEAGNDIVGGYDSRASAENAAAAQYTALKQASP